MIGQARTKLRIEDCRIAAQVRYQIRKSEMIGAKHTRRIAWPRQMAAALALDLTDATVTMIGRYLGGRDHTTVLHARQSVRRRIKDTPSYGEDYENLRLTLAVYAAQIAQVRWEEDARKPVAPPVVKVAELVPAIRKDRTAQKAVTPQASIPLPTPIVDPSPFIPGTAIPSAFERAA